jgi:hypothetical protein
MNKPAAVTMTTTTITTEIYIHHSQLNRGRRIRTRRPKEKYMPEGKPVPSITVIVISKIN